MEKLEIMHILYTLIYKIKHFYHYLNYLNATFYKNSYPCRLIDVECDNTQHQIKFQIVTKNKIISICPFELVKNSTLVNSFHPMDAAFIGSIIFKQFIMTLPCRERLKKFIEIKKNLLYHKYPSFSNRTDLPSELMQIFPIKKIESFLLQNYYPFKLIDLKTPAQNLNTMVTYTSLHKREGFTKPLVTIMNDSTFIEKIRPIETIKLGFIHSGDTAFKQTTW